MNSMPHAADDFSNGFQPQDSDVYIAVMGVTGAGKSTFISRCTDQNVEIGHDLQACTQGVGVYQSSLFLDKNVYLVDTPGFDDTNRTDKEVLKEIATWLGTAYTKKIRLSGIIYLHRITDTRMQGSARKNLFMFKKLCGPTALQRVILATTMWERLADEEMGAKREKELIETEEFWGWMTRQGSQVKRHQDTKKSAKRLLQTFVSSGDTPVTLKIQEEIVDGHKNLDQTGAGMELDSALAQEKEKYRREVAELKAEMKEALATHDTETAKILRESRKEVEDKIKILDRDRQELKVSFENLYKERVAKLEDQLRSQREANSQMHQSMQDLMAEMKVERERSRTPVPQTRNTPDNGDYGYNIYNNVDEHAYQHNKFHSSFLTCLTCHRRFRDRDTLFDHLEARERAGQSHARDTTTLVPERLTRWGMYVT